MTNSGLKNELYVRELLDNGSLSITGKNDSNIYIFDKASNTGIIYGKLIKPKYNESELVKAIDTEIKEFRLKLVDTVQSASLDNTQIAITE